MAHFEKYCFVAEVTLNNYMKNSVNYSSISSLKMNAKIYPKL